MTRKRITKQHAMKLVHEYFDALETYMLASGHEHGEAAADEALDRLGEIESELSHTGLDKKLRSKALQIIGAGGSK